jgi:hypothetical protein
MRRRWPLSACVGAARTPGAAGRKTRPPGWYAGCCLGRRWLRPYRDPGRASGRLRERWTSSDQQARCWQREPTQHPAEQLWTWTAWMCQVSGCCIEQVLYCCSSARIPHEEAWLPGGLRFVDSPSSRARHRICRLGEPGGRVKLAGRISYALQSRPAAGGSQWKSRERATSPPSSAV